MSRKKIVDRLVVTVVVALGAFFTLLFALLLTVGDLTDPHDRCTTKQYTSIRVCDMSK